MQSRIVVSYETGPRTQIPGSLASKLTPGIGSTPAAASRPITAQAGNRVVRKRHAVWAALPPIALAFDCSLAQPFFFRKDILAEPVLPLGRVTRDP